MNMNRELIQLLEAYGQYIEDGLPQEVLRPMAERINGLLAAESVMNEVIQGRVK